MMTDTVRATVTRAERPGWVELNRRVKAAFEELANEYPGDVDIPDVESGVNFVLGRVEFVADAPAIERREKLGRSIDSAVAMSPVADECFLLGAMWAAHWIDDHVAGKAISELY